MSRIIYINQKEYNYLRKHSSPDSKMLNYLQQGLIVESLDGEAYALERAYYPNTSLFKRLYPKGIENGMFWAVIKVKL